MAEQEIDKTHQEYDAYLNTWKLIRDCMAGEDAVKLQRETYLPYPVAIPRALKETEKFKDKYEVFLAGAHFTNYTEQVVDDFLAGCFRRDIQMDGIPGEIEQMDFDDIAREAIKYTSSYGRCFMLADYPDVPAGLTKEQEDALGIQAYIAIYSPLAVINWATQKVAGKDILQRVVIVEDYTTDKSEIKQRFRELVMDKGIYTVRVHTKLESGQWEIKESIPKQNGKTISQIPGTFVGSVNNNTKVDRAPIIGVAKSNIKHYQTFADLFFVQTYIGHPQLVVTGIAPGAMLDNQGKKKEIEVEVGASLIMTFEGETAKAEYLAIDAGNLVHFKTLEQLEKSMLEQGARIKSWSIKSGVESADAMRIRNAGANSMLASVVTNVERAMVYCLGHVAAFMGVANAEIVIDINKEFVDVSPDTALIGTLGGQVQGGNLPRRIYFEYLQRVGILGEEEDLEVLETELEEVSVDSGNE